MATDSFVRVAVDGAGKRIRNLAIWLPIDLADGAGPSLVRTEQQVVSLAGDDGKLLDLDIKSVLEAMLLVQQETLEAVGGGAWGEAKAGRVWGGAAAPEPGQAGALIKAFGDRSGRQVVLPWGTREMFGSNATGAITGTAATTLVPAQPGFYADLVALFISNTSASTNARADVSDGTKTYAFQTIGGGGPVGFAGGGYILPASKPGTEWTITMAGAVTDIRATAIFIKHK